MIAATVLQRRDFQSEAVIIETLLARADAEGAGQNEGMTMYEVILIAEDGQYALTDPMPERQALAWIDANEHRYGGGQRLALQYVEC